MAPLCPPKLDFGVFNYHSSLVYTDPGVSASSRKWFQSTSLLKCLLDQSVSPSKRPSSSKRLLPHGSYPTVFYWVQTGWQPGCLKPPNAIIVPTHPHLDPKHLALCLANSKCSITTCWAISKEEKTVVMRCSWKGPILDLGQYPPLENDSQGEACPHFFSQLSLASPLIEGKATLEKTVFK